MTEPTRPISAKVAAIREMRAKELAEREAVDARLAKDVQAEMKRLREKEEHSRPEREAEDARLAKGVQAEMKRLHRLREGRGDEERIYVVADPDAVPTFSDSDGAPILQYGWAPEHRMWGWTLSYEEPDGSGVGTYFTPGDVEAPPVEGIRAVLVYPHEDH